MYSLINSLVIGAIRARYVTLIAALVIVLAGAIAWHRLPLEAYPELSNPQVRIISLYPGKGAEEVEKLVTIPLEKELYGIPKETALRS
ncbi:MAG: efflux RND transporter permease subunit, partial [Cyanobacteria bacterium HKST-UBA02]|nr:efflux RND transporter permease subunit [Cyanobacteria bacterium HKST-UBA02]